jgi:hypothetical protein
MGDDCVLLVQLPLFLCAMAYCTPSRTFLRTMLCHACLVVYFDNSVVPEHMFIQKFSAFLEADVATANAALGPLGVLSVRVCFVAAALAKQIALGVFLPCCLVLRAEHENRKAFVMRLHGSPAAPRIINHVTLSVALLSCSVVIVPAVLDGSEAGAAGSLVSLATTFLPILVSSIVLFFYAYAMEPGEEGSLVSPLYD